MLSGQGHLVDEPQANRSVDCDQSLHRRSPTTEIAKGAGNGRRPQTANCGHERHRQVTATDVQTRSRPHAGSQWDNDLDWMHRIDVKAIQPRCGQAGEDGIWWQIGAPGEQQLPGVLA